jgi:fumarate reductase subunit D
VKTLMLKLEPIVWGLFGLGMMVVALLFPGWLLVVGVAGPMDLLSPEALSYERMLGLFGHPIGRAIGAAAVALPLWAGAHHIRHLAIDFGGIARDAIFGALCYAVALGGSVLAVLTVLAL